MKNKKIYRIISAIGLISQFIVILVSQLAKPKKTKGGIIFLIISAIGGLFGAYILYKDVIAPKVSQFINDLTHIDDIEDDEDDILSFDDFWSTNSAEEAISGEE